MSNTKFLVCGVAGRTVNASSNYVATTVWLLVLRIRKVFGTVKVLGIGNRIRGLLYRPCNFVVVV